MVFEVKKLVSVTQISNKKSFIVRRKISLGKEDVRGVGGGVRRASNEIVVENKIKNSKEKRRTNDV